MTGHTSTQAYPAIGKRNLRTALIGAIVLPLLFSLSACVAFPGVNPLNPMGPSSTTPSQDDEANLPPLSPDEQAKKQAFDMYSAKLAIWLSTQHIDESNYPDPLVGTWTVEYSAGLFVFTQDEFTWYEDKDVLDDNYYKGTYGYMPGAQTNSGYVLDQGEGNDCYSVFQHYTATKVDGVDQPTNFYGVFIIQRLGSPDSIYVNNQRTGGEFTLTRVQ